MIKKNRTYRRPKPIRVGGTLKRSEPWVYTKQRYWKLVWRSGLAFGYMEDLLRILNQRLNQEIHEEILREMWPNAA